MTCRAAALLLIAALGGGCQAPPVRMETRLRALEGVAVTDAPAVDQIQLDSPYGGSLRVEDIEAGKDVRRAFVGRESLVLRWTLRPQKGAQMEMALTSKPRSRLESYQIRGGPPGALRDLPFLTPSNASPWVEIRFTLAGANGSPYVVEVSVRAPTGRAVIAEPTLLMPANRARPNVLIYVIDCLRADRVGAFGSRRGLSPAIDAFAREAVVLDQTWACASWTKPSVACLFTGRYPPRHGARTVSDRIADGTPTLAEAFSRAGYSTRAVVANPILDAEHFGFGRGFRSYRNLARDYAGLAVNAVPADARLITDDVAGWLPAVRDRPFFLYLHSLDLHYPYLARETPGQPKLAENASESDLYDSEFAYNDHEIGRLLAILKQEHRLEDTIVVVTADHGEEFGEHGTTRHGHSLYQDLVHVPLVIRLPGGEGAGARISDPVSLVDLPQTVLELASLPGLAEADGVSLARRFRGPALARPLPIFAEQISPVETLYAVRNERYKAIDELVPKEESLLFDLSSDPRETTPLVDARAGIATLRRQLAEFTAQAQQGLHLTVEPDPDNASVDITLRSPEALERVYRMGQRTGEPLKISPDSRVVTYSFHRSGFQHRLVAVPVDASVPLEVEIRVAGVPVDPSRVRMGSGMARRGASWSVIPAVALPPKGVEERPIRVWYQPAPAGSRIATLDPKLREDLRALGYIK